MELYLVTGNRNKVREFEEILDIKLKHAHIELEELQDFDSDKVAEHKAREAFSKLGKPLIVNDESVYLDFLNGFPGPFIKWFWDVVTPERICELAHKTGNTKAWARSTITYFDGKELKHFRGVVKGTISEKPKGRTGFGWDSIFIPEGHSKTFSEMSPFEKHAISMRAKAIGQLRPFLQKIKP